MKKIYCVICSKYGKFENPKISYILEKTSILFIYYSKCTNEDEKIFKEEESVKILKMHLIENM